MRASGGSRRAATSGMAQVQTDLTLSLHTMAEHQTNLKTLLTYVQRLEAAVSYYATVATWGPDGVARHPATDEEDRGEIARLALLRHVNVFPIATILPLVWMATQ